MDNELAACSTVMCACCRKQEEIDLLNLCGRCGQFTHDAGASGCAGMCACELRRRGEKQEKLLEEESFSHSGRVGG